MITIGINPAPDLFTVVAAQRLGRERVRQDHLHLAPV
jgi:hypothetical protein